MGLHIKIFNDTEWAAAKAALDAAGHAEVASLKSNTAHFIAKLETSFPDVYTGIEQGIHDLKDSSLSGGEKAVKVATDVLTTAPAILHALPGIKSALVAAVTQFFSDEISDFKSIGLETIAKL